ncbi:MAG: hypothetical protein PHE51_02090 [Eubacteriales bacterium]|nr:hypothetical protein [Eubacteriales bacterium]
MKKIEIFEQAIENKVKDLRAEGINPTLFWAYRESIDSGNDKIDFNECIWESEIEDIVNCLRENGIVEFTISSTFASLIETLAAFQRHGYQMAGLTEVNSRHTDVFTGKKTRIPAIKFSAKEV